MSLFTERLTKILKNGKTVVIPMDHGVSAGPLPGLVDMPASIRSMQTSADAILVHKGIAKQYPTLFADQPLILHLSASSDLSPRSLKKVLVCTVGEAIELGADMISVHVNVGNEYDADMIRDLGDVSRECFRSEIPLLAMMYPRGPEVKDPKGVREVKIAARLGAELGADIVKVPYTGSTETFKEVVRGCPVPVVIAGGSKEGDRAVLEMIRGAVDAGAAGVSLGRNAWQHEHPEGMVKAIRAIVHENASADDALQKITNEL